MLSVLIVFTVRAVCRSHEHLFVYEVAGECYSRDAEAWEGASEAVPSGERAGVSPCLTARLLV